MTDRPEQPNDSQPLRGGWHAPSTPTLWQTPTVEQSPPAEWRQVNALPEELEEEPDVQGGWHLPKPDDTTFNPDDKVEVVPSGTAAGPAANLRPEDLIAEIVGQKPRQTAPAPEDLVPRSERSRSAARPEDEDETVAADALDDEDTLLLDEQTGMGELEALGALDDEDDEVFSMSEMVALASLVEGAQDSALDAQDINAEDLSPAERALLNVALDAESELPQLSAEDATQTLSDTSQQAGGKSAAEIAAEMAAQVGQQDAQPYGGYGQQQQQLTPEQQQLANQFRETRRQVGVLRQQYEQGQIDYQQLQQELQNNSIQDAQGNWWMIGYETDNWFRYNNMTQQWEDAQPPVPLDAPSPATMTGTGDMQQVLPDSLPIVPEGRGTVPIEEYTRDYDATQYTEAQQQYSQQYGIDSQDTPVPYPDQPANDPNLTMVGRSAYTQNLPGADPTAQNLDIVEGYDPQATMPSAGVYDGEAIDTPYEQPPSDYGTTAPDYDFEGQVAPDAYVAGRERQQSRLLTTLLIGIFVIAACGLVSVISFVGYAAFWYNNTVEPHRAAIASLANYQPEFQIARVLDAGGNEIVTLTSQEGAREPVSIEANEVSPFFVHAVVSSEDPTYYENPGLNILSIARAFWQNVRAGEIESGASTITQQIAKNLILDDQSPTAQRKATEIAVALEIANTYSKNQVLDIYINEFPFGNQTFGVEAASQFYFDKPAADLNMAEAAMLSGLLPAPESSNPVRDQEAAFDSMNIVLNRMIRTGCLNFQHGNQSPFCINENTLVDGARLYQISSDGSFGGALAVFIAQVEARNYRSREGSFVHPHFINLITARIENEFGPNALYQRGFTIRTTLIPRIQDAAEFQLRNGLNPYSINGVDTGAVIVLDPTTGAIRALVGSPDFTNEKIDGQVDNTRTWQQPGSAIKPITYTAALTGTSGGYLTPASILWDVPSQYDTNGDGVADYAPVNFRGQFQGPISVRSALQQSLNVPAVKAYQFIGPNAFVNTANTMGITFLDDSTFGLASALGANEVRLIDMAEAYGTLAADGIFHSAYAIESITENINGRQVPVELAGTSLGPQAPRQAVSEQVAYLMQNILSDNNARAPQFGTSGPLSGRSLGLENQNQVAVKTGTSNGARDLWTVGFTNNWVVGVWAGTVDNSATTGDLTGSAVAAPIWNLIMAEAMNRNNPGFFENPANVVQNTVCSLTGTLAPNPADCPAERIAEIYIQQQPPPNPDRGFVQTLEIDSWTGLRANQWCPNYRVQQRFSNINDPFATNWLNTSARGQQILNALNLTSNLAAPPQGECQQGQPIPSIDLNFPQPGSTVGVEGTLTVTGQVSASDLQRWELQLAASGASSFSPITQNSTQQIPQAGTVLTQWDSSSVTNGTYTLRLAAFSSSGGFVFRDATIQIQNVPPTPTPTPTQLPTPFNSDSQSFTPLPFDPTPTATVAP